MGEIIKVSMTFRSAEQGGRVQMPRGTGYCPHLCVSGHDILLAVRLHDCPHDAEFGKTYIVQAELMYSPELDYSILSAGTEFDVKEGPKTVATGQVLEDTQHVPDPDQSRDSVRTARSGDSIVCSSESIHRE